MLLPPILTFPLAGGKGFNIQSDFRTLTHTHCSVTP